MSKSEGKQLAINFTANLTEISETPSTDKEVQDGTWTSKNTYDGWAYIKDGNIGTNWRCTNVDNYVQIQRPVSTFNGIKVYKPGSYRPTTYNILTSDNGTNFTSRKTGNFEVSTGWETITLDTPITANYIRIIFGLVNLVTIGELSILVSEKDHQTSVGDFTITGQEYTFVDGPDHNGELLDKTYQVQESKRKTGTQDTIELIIKDSTPFNSVIGDLTVAYDQSKGNLMGDGGAVEGFEETFTPTDLCPYLNPRIREYINASVDSIIDLIEIIKTNTYAKNEYIEANVSATIELVYIDLINP